MITTHGVITMTRTWGPEQTLLFADIPISTTYREGNGPVLQKNGYTSAIGEHGETFVYCPESLITVRKLREVRKDDQGDQ